MSTYNGWTNYETWLANLWIGEEGNYWQERAAEAYGAAEASTYNTRAEEAVIEIARQVQEEHELRAENIGTTGLLADLINAALRSVNWYEIAEHLLADAREDEEETNEEG